MKCHCRTFLAATSWTSSESWLRVPRWTPSTLCWCIAILCSCSGTSYLEFPPTTNTPPCNDHTTLPDYAPILFFNQPALCTCCTSYWVT